MFAPVTTIPGTPTHRIPERVKRQWDTGELNRVWISDITYLRTGEGWLYLCVVRDACSRRVLGWAMDSHQDADLVERGIRTAKTLRGQVPGKIVFHADRGTQYTSTQLHLACEELHLDQSMGRTGVARWIEVVYNRRRRHSSIGYKPPVNYEHQMMESSTLEQAA